MSFLCEWIRSLDYDDVNIEFPYISRHEVFRHVLSKQGRTYRHHRAMRISVSRKADALTLALSILIDLG